MARNRISRPKMLFKAAVLLLVAAQALAHRIEIEPGQKECYYETLSPKDRVCTAVRSARLEDD